MIGRLAALAPFTLLLVPGAAVGQVPPASRPATVTATGTATVTLEPDHAVVQFGVVTRGPTAADAGARNAELVRAVLGALAVQGIAEDDLATSGYGIHAEWNRERGERDLASYVAQNMVQATVRDLARVGAVIDAATGAGANDVAGLRFAATRSDDARREALSEAVRAARDDAEAMAAAAGGRLGTLLEISTGGGGGPVPQYEMMRVRDAGPTPVIAGDLTVAATISAVWTFLPNP